MQFGSCGYPRGEVRLRLFSNNTPIKKRFSVCFLVNWCIEDCAMTPIGNPAVAAAYDAYPDDVRRCLLDLRQLILDVAESHPGIGALEETLKWGEPSYLAKDGSTIRLGVPKAESRCYAMYFNCNTKLVDTFREVYSTDFSFEGNRAIVFQLGESVQTDRLKHCVELALRYHRVKSLPLLGI